MPRDLRREVLDLSGEDGYLMLLLLHKLGYNLSSDIYSFLATDREHVL
jgi:hypothetical protein